MWIAQGRDPANMSPRDIVKLLNESNLSAFVVTGKRV